MYENSPAVVNFQRYRQRRDSVQQQQQDVTNSRNMGVYQELEQHSPNSAEDEFINESQRICESLKVNSSTTTGADEMLVEEVRSYPCIWDNGTNSHRNIFKKQQAWREIANELNKDGK